MNAKAKQDKEIKIQEDTTLITIPPVANQADKLIELAIQSNADVDRLDQLLALKERYDKEEARKQFTAALASFKLEDILIVKDKSVGYNNQDGSFTGYKHASLGNIIRQAVPLMSLHGLSHRWDLVQEQGKITVTCILTHKGGHSEKVALFAEADDTGKKNKIQQVASTVTYLERYTFLSITGLAVEDQDDDGEAAGPIDLPVELIGQDEANAIHSMITDNELEMPVFLNWLFKVKGVTTIEMIPISMLATVTDKIKKGIKAKEKAADK